MTDVKRSPACGGGAGLTMHAGRDMETPTLCWRRYHHLSTASRGCAAWTGVGLFIAQRATAQSTTDDNANTVIPLNRHIDESVRVAKSQTVPNQHTESECVEDIGVDGTGMETRCGSRRLPRLSALWMGASKRPDRQLCRCVRCTITECVELGSPMILWTNGGQQHRTAMC